MPTKSMTDVAYDIMSSKKRAVQFSKLWAEVAKQTNASGEDVAQFYSDLTLDGRFASLKENKWDLKSRRKYSESHVDLKKIELDDSDSEYESEEDIENSEEDSENYLGRLIYVCLFCYNYCI